MSMLKAMSKKVLRSIFRKNQGIYKFQNSITTPYKLTYDENANLEFW